MGVVMGYQYVVVRLPAFVDEEEVWTARINAVAADGWRLVTITTTDKKGLVTALATFEREAL